MNRILLSISTGLCLTLAPLWSAAPSAAVTPADIDPAASRMILADGEQPLDEAAVLELLGLATPGKAEKPAPKPATTLTYLLAFQKPLAIGSVLGASGEIRILKSSAAWPPDPKKEADWDVVKVPSNQSAPSVTALPPKLQTRALIVPIAVPRNSTPRLQLLTPRFTNQTPFAVANADTEWTTEPYLSAPYTHDAGHLTRGYGNWINSGKGSSGINSRPPISDVDPAWVVLSWVTPQRLSTLVLQDNFEKIELQSYDGPPGINAAAATEAEWRNVRKFTETRVGSERWLTFDPIETRAVRIKILKTKDGPVAKMAGFHALTDLGDAPVNLAQKPASETPPVEISYDLAEAGKVTMVIDNEQGIRVRNLTANAEREAGPNAQPWDLKDDDGNYVVPGKYRWRAITHPPLEFRYQLTAYPNVTSYFPERPAWLTGHNGPGGWLADHSSPVAACTTGDRVFLGSPVAESGVSLIETDLEGRKVWGFHSFEAWTGAGMLATDGAELFNIVPRQGSEKIWAIDLESRKSRTVTAMDSSADRKRGVQGFAARDGKIYLAIHAADDWLNNAVSAGDIDLANSIPTYATARPARAAHEVVADPRQDFLRLLRLKGTPSGQRATGLTYLETTKDLDREQNLVVAFDKPVAIGSLVFPLPPKEEKVQFQIRILKPDAPYPPRMKEPDDWTKVPIPPDQTAWSVVALPPETVTRALRFSFTQGGVATTEDELLSAVDSKEDGPSLDLLDGPAKSKTGLETKTDAWQRKIEGMKLLGRRYENLAPSAKVVVSSGTVNPDGSWDAQRTEPLSKEDPAIYSMEWKTPQPIRGVAIKEIDGELTEIDAYTGPANGPIDIKSSANWEKVGAYKQPLREYYQPDDNHNSFARYLDGYVDFGREVSTRAIRLRIVKQWDVKGHRPGGVRVDQGGQTLDLKRARIYGVAALKYLGGEPLPEPIVTERLEILDAKSGKVVKELPLKKAGSPTGGAYRGNMLAFGPTGDLFAIADQKLVRLNLENGNATQLAGDLVKPTALAAGPNGDLYVFDAAPDRKTIRVYDSQGKFLREIGEAGGYQAGPWNPKRLDNISALAVDKLNQVWAVDRNLWPKRISLWTQNGEFLKEFLGPTEYGGGGTVDPGDSRRMFYGPLEFEIDWDKGTTRLKNLLSTDGAITGDVPVRLDDRLYLTNVRPRDFGTSSAYLYLHEGDRARLVAMIGIAGEHPMMRDPELTKALGGKVLMDHLGVWSDLNGDGKAQKEELQLWPKGDLRVAAMFDSKLNAQIGSIGFRVKEWLPNGAPVYERVDNPKIAKGMTLPLDNGNFYHFESSGQDTKIAGIAPDGKVLWTYPTEGSGVHALTRSKPLFPGQIVCMLGYAGHTTAHAGDLGEFVVTNTNTGVLNLMTADGLFAGQVFSDMRDRRSTPWSQAETGRNVDMGRTTLGQEHFNAYFTKTKDNRYFAVVGHNHASVVEVLGMDRFKRFGGEIEITQAQLKETQAWAHANEQRRVYARAPVIDAYRVASPPKLDGKLNDWPEAASSQIDDKAKFRLAYDDQFLYVAYEIQGRGPLKNQGEQWDRLFKSGAAVDLQISVDPAAPADRKIPVKGDQRLLMTFMGDEPAAVLYEAVVPGTPADKVWEVVSPVGKASFDRVRKVDSVRLFPSGDGNQYILEAAIPLKELGLTITPGLRLKLDWGILVSGPQGTEVQQREYWANQFTQIVSDAPSEAELHPDLWGHVRFQEKAADSHLDPGTAKPDEGLKDLLDDLK